MIKTKFSDYCLVPLFGLVLMVLVLTGRTANSSAEGNQLDSNGLVEIEVPGRLEDQYKMRRTRWGFDLGADFHKLKPNDQSFAESFNNKDVGIAEIHIGPKLNAGPISLSAAMIYGQGSVSGNVDNIDTFIMFTKQGSMFTLFLDGVFKEPYVVPYFSYQYFKLNYDVKLGDEKRNGDLGFVSAILAGLMFQLNWIEPETSYQSRIDNGIENAYLVVFANQYYGGSKTSDLDTSSDWNYGAGLRLEF